MVALRSGSQRRRGEDLQSSDGGGYRESYRCPGQLAQIRPCAFMIGASNRWVMLIFSFNRFYAAPMYSVAFTSRCIHQDFFFFAINIHQDFVTKSVYFHLDFLFRSRSGGVDFIVPSPISVQGETGVWRHQGAEGDDDSRGWPQSLARR